MWHEMATYTTWACILSKRILFGNSSVYEVQIRLLRGLILRSLSWPFGKLATLGMPSIFSNASDAPPLDRPSNAFAKYTSPYTTHIFRALTSQLATSFKTVIK